MWVKPVRKPSAFKTAWPISTPGRIRGSCTCRSVTVCGLTHSWVLAISGFGRYQATFQ